MLMMSLDRPTLISGLLFMAGVIILPIFFGWILYIPINHENMNIWKFIAGKVYIMIHWEWVWESINSYMIAGKILNGELPPLIYQFCDLQMCYSYSLRLRIWQT